MKLSRNVVLLATLLGPLSVFTAVQGCNDNSTDPEQVRDPLPAPSNDLQASEIMSIQGLRSIHYKKYMKYTVDGIPDTGFRLAFEYYLDTNRVRVHDFIRDEILMYDRGLNTAWACHEGWCQPFSPRDVSMYYNSEARFIVGSYLDSSAAYLRTEVVDQKICDVFADTNGEIEWVWVPHRVPIKLFVEDSLGSHQLTNEIEMRSMEINTQLPEDVFQLPR